jgi:predicted permease
VFPTSEILRSILPAYLLIVAGLVLRRLGVLRREHDEGVMHVVFHVMYPCFILDKILGSDAVGSLSKVAWPMALGFLLPIVGIGIGWLVGRCLGMEKGTGQRTFALSSGVQNFGYTAIPVVQQLWPAGAIAVLFVHNLGVECAMWSVGVMLMSGSKGIEWRRLINGPMFAVVGGLLLVGLSWDHHVTGPPREAMRMLGQGAFPVAIALTGAMMFDMLGQERPSWKVGFGGALVRLVISPAVILGAAKFLPVATELKQVLLVQAAMPAAMTPVLFARLYGGRPAVAVQIVVATTLLSLLTLPWVIAWGKVWLGL